MLSLYFKCEAKPFRTEGRLGVPSLLRCLGMWRCRRYTWRFHPRERLCSNVDSVQFCGVFHQSISTDGRIPSVCRGNSTVAWENIGGLIIVQE